MKLTVEAIAKFLGFLTATQAKAEGFTHYGSYYGIPLWMSDVDSDGPAIVVKWSPFNYAMDLFMWIEGFFFPLIHGADAEPMFMFKIYGELK